MLLHGHSMLLHGRRSTKSFEIRISAKKFYHKFFERTFFLNDIVYLVVTKEIES